MEEEEGVGGQKGRGLKPGPTTGAKKADSIRLYGFFLV